MQIQPRRVATSLTELGDFWIRQQLGAHASVLRTLAGKNEGDLGHEHKATVWVVGDEVLARRDPDGWLRWAVARLEDWGLMLDSDPKLPSWPSLVVERSVHGSWWADPDVHLINAMGTRLTQHPDVVHSMLVSSKLTCVHRRLWPAFLAVALARDDWKLEGLSSGARSVWDRLQHSERLHADEPGLPTESAKTNGRFMRELEGRLLCAGGSIHTPRGSHAKYVMTWEAWMGDHSLLPPLISATAGRSQLADCVERLNLEFGGRGGLPWGRTTRS
ncbi:MAG TPA: hypothetical protein VGU71_04565 [Candidatus Dormibacteraeota bacterium]|nr:hypothetical protein [Candidatus Dormibacteraeota bacterium]